MNGWTLRDANNSITVPAQGQSQQYIDLFNAGIIDDPLYGLNDTAEAWVQRTNWTYTSPSLAELKSGNGSQTWLIFEGLDTFTTISLCNETIGNTENQFRQYLFDATAALDLCANPVLSIEFGSATSITHDISSSSLGDGTSPFSGVSCY